MSLQSKDIAKYAVHLHRQNSESLGFIPQSRVEQYATAGQVLVEYDNGELCGYLIWGTDGRWFRIYQACIDYDVRRRKHGFNLVRRCIALAEGCQAITLRCRENLQANQFWREAGFHVASVVPGGKRRGRQLNVWVMPLPSAQKDVWGFAV